MNCILKNHNYFIQNIFTFISEDSVFYKFELPTRQELLHCSLKKKLKTERKGWMHGHLHSPVQLTRFLCPRHGHTDRRKTEETIRKDRLPLASLSVRPSVRLSSLKNLSAIKPRSLGPIAKPPGGARTLPAAAGEIHPALVSSSFCR